MEWHISALTLFLGLFVLLAIGLPVAFSLGLASLVGILIFIGPQGLGQMNILMVEYATNSAFICLPLFVLMAELIAVSGAANDIFSAAQKWLNRLPGSLGISTTFASGVFGAACGTSSGGAAAMGLVTIPELLRRGYSHRLTTGTVAAGGTLSILIPPSGIMILYALVTEQSIGRMFIAGIIPGAMMIGLFSLYILIYAKLRPQEAPSLPAVSWRERWTSLRPIWAISSVITIVFGSIYAGIGTINESAAIGAFVALIIALKRRISWHLFKEVAIRTVRVTCFIFFIIFGAMTFGYLLSYLRIPFELSELMVNAGTTPILFILLIMVLYLILGCFLDPASILVLTIPVLYPTVEKLGFDPIWFGILATINMEMANITPPVGLNLFVVKSVCPPEVNLGDIIWGAAPFVVLLALGVTAIIIWPEIALWLPRTMVGP